VRHASSAQEGCRQTPSRVEKFCEINRNALLVTKSPDTEAQSSVSISGSPEHVHDLGGGAHLPLQVDNCHPTFFNAATSASLFPGIPHHQFLSLM
jgi:hypothetical protein